jgi:signal transduction histidine kinase
LTHIKDFGNELFTDTAISFEFNSIDESLSYISLPMEYSRNIPMIFKELLNNILKHAHADRVTLSLDNIDRSCIHLTLKDNGCGFEQEEARKGQGINNVNTRIKRIGGEMQIKSCKGQGTVVDLKIKINQAVIN